MYPVSAQFLATLASSDRQVVTRAEVWTGFTADTPSQFLAELGTVVSGTVNVTDTREVRRTCTVTLATRGLPYDDVIPVTPKSLLDPSTGNLLRLYRGFRYTKSVTLPTGSVTSEELVPLGVFRLSKPIVADTGSALTVTISGNDLSAWVARQAWTEPYVIDAGTNLATAIQEGMATRYPGLKYVCSPTSYKVPATTFGAQAGSDTADPMSDFQGLATDAGMELFFDVLGQVVLRPISTPATSPLVWSYEEGPTCTLTAAGRTLTETQQYSGVQVIGNGPGGAPVSVTIWTETPDSPTYVTGPWGKIPYVYTTSAFPATGQSTTEALAQAQAVAESLFPLVVKAMDEPTFSTVPNPAMQEGDCITLVRARIGLGGPGLPAPAYAVSGFTIPLGVGIDETVTCRPRRQGGS